jgi:hypothetical protein
MSYLYNNQVDFVARSLDSAARLRTSTPATLFEHSNQFGTNPIKWDKATSGTGSITDTTVTSSTVLATGGTASGAQAVRATRVYYRYQIGKSLYLGMSFNFGTGVAGCSKRVGFYDASNGIFLEQNGTTINITVRNQGTDVATPSTSWNVDRLDGTGPSGVTFNPLGTHDFRVDFFGSFGMRFYLYLKGTFWLIHTIENANITTPAPVPGPATLNLTVRQEIINTTTVSSASSMSVYNANVMSEGVEQNLPAYSFSASNGITTIALTTSPRPVLSIQAKTLGIDGTSRNYGQIRPTSVNVYTSAAIFVQFIYNGTLTGSSFVSAGPLSIANYDVSATAITGGLLVDSNYVTPNGTGGGATGEVATPTSVHFPLVYSSLANNQDTVTVVAQTFTAGANCSASFSWNEYY